MSFTGRFNENFRRESDLPSADLPRSTLEEIQELQEIREREVANMEVDADE